MGCIVIIANGVEMYKFKEKYSEINGAPLCMCNVSKHFSVDYMKKTGLYEHVYDFSVNYDSIDVMLGICK